MVITSQCHQNILFQIRKVVTRIFKTNNRAHHFTEQGEVAEAVDDETEHWPVPPRLREELNKIKFEYCAVPLPVYVNEFFVELAHVNNCIKGALVAHNDVANIRWARKSARANCSISSVERAWTHRV